MIIFECSACGLKFQDKSSLVKHFWSEHDDLSGGPCPNCLSPIPLGLSHREGSILRRRALSTMEDEPEMEVREVHGRNIIEDLFDSRPPWYVFCSPDCRNEYERLLRTSKIHGNPDTAHWEKEYTDQYD